MFVQKVKVIGQGHYTFHVWSGPADMRKMPCLATYISLSKLDIPDSFAIFDRLLVVLQDWRVSPVQLFPF